MLDPFFTEERAAFRDTIRRYVDDRLRPNADEWDEAGEIPWAVHEEVGALGGYGFGVPEELGGLGFDDCFMRAAYQEELARAGAGGIPAAINGRTISIDPLVRLASPEIAKRVVPEVVSGRKGSSLGITEPSGGSDVANMKTTARRDGNGWRINGSKTFITGGMKSDYFVIGARTGGEGITGISLFFVEADTDGFTRQSLDRKMGWWCSDQATLFFDDAFVPADALMGEVDHGFLAIMENFNLERVGLIAGSLGAMKAIYEDAISWAEQRETFGKPLIKHQVIRHKVADISARIDATEAYLNQICWQVNESFAGRAEMPVAEICKAKFLTTKNLEFVASEGMQIMGGAGYLRGNRIERIYREVKVMAIGGGSEEIMRDLAVRQMGF